MGGEKLRAGRCWKRVWVIKHLADIKTLLMMSFIMHGASFRLFLCRLTAGAKSENVDFELRIDGK